MTVLSILIPVRDYPVLPFAQALAEGIEKVGISAEIVIGDDGSDPSWSDRYHSWHHPLVRILRPSKNLGRARIRNLLAAEAKGQYLLFADADAMVPMAPEIFLAHYMETAQSHPVVCGGTLYPDQPPAEPEFFLRWYYGRKREQMEAKARNKNPHTGFSAFNFLIRRDLFLKYPFEETLTQYGHEDTLFGLRLKVEGVPVHHIDNPLLHLGYEPARSFLKKSRTALMNLLRMQDQLSAYPEYCRQIRLLNTARRARLLGLDRLLASLFSLRRYTWENRLMSRDPRMWIFDLYKLSCYCQLSRATPEGDLESREAAPVQFQ